MHESYTEMAAEALREVGVLILVFSLLDRLIAGSITLLWTLSATAIRGASFFLGCMLERGRVGA